MKKFLSIFMLLISLSAWSEPKAPVPYQIPALVGSHTIMVRNPEYNEMQDPKFITALWILVGMMIVLGTIDPIMDFFFERKLKKLVLRANKEKK